MIISQQGHHGRKGSLSTLPRPGPQAEVHVSVTQRNLPQGLDAEQTVIGLQNQVLQSFIHVYIRHSELGFHNRLSGEEANTGQWCGVYRNKKSNAQKVMCLFK